MQRRIKRVVALYWVYYNQQDQAVCVQRVNDDTNKIIAGSLPTGPYSRQLVTDTFALSEAIDQALLGRQDRVNKSKGRRYQVTSELERELELGVSHSALKAKYGLSRATYYRLRSGLD